MSISREIWRKALQLSRDISPLFEKTYYVVDILPEQVKADSKGQYFAVEKYYSGRMHLRMKFADVLLKLNCYYDFDVCINDEWTTNPAPGILAASVCECPHVDVLVGEALITLDREDLYMTVYNAPDDMLDMLGKLAGAEGLFLWMPPQN